MSPVPSRDRLDELTVKGVHVALRTVALAPEQRAARRLRAQAELLPAPGPDAPKVAFLTPRSWASHVQWEAMIGHALRLRGADVSYITCGGGLEICDRTNTWEAPPMPCRTCDGYVDDALAAHGFERHPLRDGWEEDDPAPWPEIDALSLGELERLQDDGLDLGRLVEIPAKWFLMVGTYEGDPLAPLTLRRFLRSARRVARGLARTLDRLRPDVVVMLNGLFLFEAIAAALCRARGIEIVSYERALIKETLIFRRGGAACELDLSPWWDERKRRPLTDADEQGLDEYLAERRHGRRTIDRYWDRVQFDLPPRKTSGRLVSLFTNVTWDSAVIGTEIAFPSMSAWVAGAIEAFAARPEHELVIRVHPAEAKLSGRETREPIGRFIETRFPVLPPNVTVIGADDPRSSYPLMEASDVGLAFASTAGLELALYDTPVIVAARTHYRGRGFTIDVSSPEEFERALDATLADPAAHAPDRDLARRYGWLFFFGAPIRSPGVEEHVLGLARLTVSDLQEMAPGADPEIDRICDGILGLGDFGPKQPHPT